MTKKLLLSGCLVALSSPVLATGDHAKQLLQSSCTSCHQADIYKRDNRKVSTLNGLSSAVERCNTQLATGWFPEDVDAVVRYLNSNYYKFKQ